MKALPLFTPAVAQPVSSHLTNPPDVLLSWEGPRGDGEEKDPQRRCHGIQLGRNGSSTAQKHSFPKLCPLQNLHCDAGA